MKVAAADSKGGVPELHEVRLGHIEAGNLGSCISQLSGATSQFAHAKHHSGAFEVAAVCPEPARTRMKTIQPIPTLTSSGLECLGQ
jgi:hypothetical protein